jgi:dTMP kinase
MKGKLISFEGIDGSGKTTQMDLLERWLIDQDVEYLRTREPGGTDLGQNIRDLLFQEKQIAPLSEIFLFLADRAEHFEKVILPALDKNRIVISDRCLDSNIAYQGRHEFFFSMIDEYSRHAMHYRMPDLTILLDLPAEIAYTRCKNQNRFDVAPIEKQEEVRKKYLFISKQYSKRIHVIDATEELLMVQDKIREKVASILGLRGKGSRG